MKANRLTRPPSKRWVMKPVKIYPEVIYPLRWLTPEEFDRVAAQEIPDYLRQARLYFIVSCLTGLNHEEVGRLKINHFQISKAGYPYIHFIMKNGKKRFIPVLPAMGRIFNKIKSNSLLTPNDTLLQNLGSAKRYSNLQTLASICAIQKKITGILCRNTYSEILYQKGVPMKTIVEILGFQIHRLDLSQMISEEDILNDIQKAFYSSSKQPD